MTDTKIEFRQTYEQKNRHKNVKIYEHTNKQIQTERQTDNAEDISEGGTKFKV